MAASAARAAKAAFRISQVAPAPEIVAAHGIADPIRLVATELAGLRSNVRRLLGAGHPTLDRIAKYYFSAVDGGKHVRPMVVLLMSKATNDLVPGFDARLAEQAERLRTQSAGSIDDPLEPPDVLEDVNPDISTVAVDSRADATVLPTQRRLAEITEMIHVASLLHDDVIDEAELRRSSPSAPAAFGNKLSILAGDFLLARASVALSRLGSHEAVELVASVLANLVEGEILQMSGDPAAHRAKPTADVMDRYLRKTYLKTASLMAKSARATTILAGCGARQGWEPGERVKDAAYAYGRNLGIAFQVRGHMALSPLTTQLIDDMLDVTAASGSLGKPGSGADLKLGLATAPALFAWQENPALGPLIARRFDRPGDVETVRRSPAITSLTVAGAHDDRPVFRRGAHSRTRAAAWSACTGCATDTARERCSNGARSPCGASPE